MDDDSVLIDMEMAGVLLAACAYGDDQTERGRELVYRWICMAVLRGLDRNVANRYRHMIGKNENPRTIKKVAKTLSCYVPFTDLLSEARTAPKPPGRLTKQSPRD